MRVMWRVRLLGLALGVSLLVAGLGAGGIAAQEGRQLHYGDVVQGTINRGSFRQVYFFHGRRGDVVTVRMLPGDGNLDAVLLLADNTGSVLANSDDGEAALGAAITTLQIPADGFYFLIATRFGHALGLTEGDFELSLTREGVVSEGGIFLGYGDSVVGFIDSLAWRFTYTFEARRGDIVNVLMRRISGNLDSYVVLTTAEGQVLVANDDREGSFDAAIEDFLILDEGVYTIVVTRYGQEAGTSQGGFVLSLDTAPTSGLGLTPDAALFLRYGEELIGALDDESPLRYYTFGARRGDIVTLSMTRTGGDLDPFLVLLDASRTPLVEDDDSGPDNNALIRSYIIPANGTYFVLATRYQREGGLTAGSYVIRLEGVTGEAPVVAPGTLTILYGSTVAGSIGDEQPSATYAFLGRAGDVITIAMTRTSGDLDPLLFLFTAEGSQLATDDDSGPERDAQITAFTIPQDGTYYIIATRYQFQAGTTRGEYSLSLTRQETPTLTPASS